MILLLFSCHKKEKSFYEIKSINKDSSQIIWGNSTFKNSQNFENLGNGYGKDKSNVYYYGDIIQ